MQIITMQLRAQCAKYPKTVLKSSFLRCDTARYYGGYCINHAVFKKNFI